ncbi:head GIN domain-containing protein [Niabella yanshanensis]|uniref:Head GIN domain-containing protein n=1 Tax=Niabella yanshanensis TaxID=577386 RepID=A0ABZ0W694_9BACT|nr:head GIN domain-containing protein [Niabella yanshanensis]WQD37052.1 head GIN domain-containing protein [Niabella yanshanensis]
MKQLLSLVVIALFTFTTGCKKVFPDGPAVEENRAVGDFSKVEAAFSGNVEFVQSASKSVTVKAADNLQGYIITEVKGNTLVLKTKPNISIKGGSVTIYVSNPSMNGATISGSGNFSLKSDINTTSLDLRVSGSGNIYASKLTATNLEAEITGSGDITIEGGTINTQDIRITGNGDYHTQQMRSEQAKVKVSGSGEARLWADKKLDVQISGSGDVWYSGSPSINTSISGSGKVRKL